MKPTKPVFTRSLLSTARVSGFLGNMAAWQPFPQSQAGQWR